MAFRKLESYLQKKNRDLSAEEKQQIRERIGRGESDVYHLAEEFHCAPIQIAGIKAADAKGKTPRVSAKSVDKDVRGIRALSIRQPFAHAIIRLGKDVENRSWSTEYRGLLLIHASGRAESDPRELLSGYLAPAPSEESLKDLPTGSIVGVVDVVDCVQNSTSKWAEAGQWHWILQNPRPVEPVDCLGHLQLWRPPIEVVKKFPSWLQEQIGAIP